MSGFTYSPSIPMNVPVSQGRPTSASPAGPPQTLYDVRGMQLTPPPGWTTQARDANRVAVNQENDIAARARMSIDQLPHDGFMYHQDNYFLPYYYFSNAMIASETIRKANLLRDKVWVVPESSGQSIAAYDTYIGQIEMMPGSWIYGVRLANTAYPEVAPTDLAVQITDACTGQPLFMEFVDGRVFSQFRTTYTSRLGIIPFLLAEPRLIMEPGLVNVEVANKTATAKSFQLIFLVREPCMVLTDAQVALAEAE